MTVSRQRASQTDDSNDRGPRARTRRLMLQTAMELMQSGATPSVSEVAEAAGVSRATAYRYFPSQAALVHAVVDQALGPILTWSSNAADPKRRLDSLLQRAMPRIDAFEATFRAALRMSLEQWAQRQAGTLGTEPQFTRGHRIDLLRLALAPLEGRLPKREFDRLAQALSLVFGVEAPVILKDIWGLDAEETRTVAVWAAHALLAAAIAGAKPAPTVGEAKATAM